MARRKKGNPVHGWLILDKPLEMTSTTAVAVVKRLLDAQKAGHAGTLDPLATGILPIALGEATKTVSYAVDGEKAYRFTVKWGAETTTDDAEGPVTQHSDARPTRTAIEALAGVLGDAAPWGDAGHGAACGKIGYADFHASLLSVTPGAFPAECTTTAMTNDEKALEFTLFDLGGCVQDDTMAPTMPPLR